MKGGHFYRAQAPMPKILDLSADEPRRQLAARYLREEGSDGKNQNLQLAAIVR
jgi:hypothetical protein